MFLYPVLKGLYLFATGKSEEVRQKRARKLESLTKEKRAITSSLRIFITVIPYFGAYYYADFRTVWLILGTLHLLTASLVLIAALASRSLRQEEPEKYNEVIQESRKNLKAVTFWPKWQVHALCIFNVSVLALWLYSWRYLFT